MHGILGYFIAAKHYMLGFHRRNIPITWQPLIPNPKCPGGFGPFEGHSMGEKELDQFCNREIDYDTVIVHTPPEMYPSWLRKESGKCIIGYTVWETDRLPTTWPALLNRMPRILVPSTWNKQVFRSSGVTVDMGVVPHFNYSDTGVDDSLIQDISDKDYVFYAVEEWRARKGLQKTIQSYLSAFSGNDPTILVLKTSSNAYYQSPLGKLKRLRKLYRRMRRYLNVPDNISIRPNAEQVIRSLDRKYKNPARIKLITERVSDAEVTGLHCRGNCYVSLCSSEGWGLSPFYAAANGKPVIMTGYGGQLDYLPENDAYLVDYNLVPVRDDEASELFTAQQQWAEPDLTNAVELMKRVFENQQESVARGRKLQEYIRRRFNEDVVIDLFLDQIDQTRHNHG